MTKPARVKPASIGFPSADVSLIVAAATLINVFSTTVPRSS